MHRPALAVADARLPPSQLGHDDIGIDPVGEHVAMVAIAGDDAVTLAIERALEPYRHRFLPDVEVAETADQAQAVKLPGFFLEPADQQHLLIESEHFIGAGGVTRTLLVSLLTAVQRELLVFCGLRSGLRLDRISWLGQLQ